MTEFIYVQIQIVGNVTDGFGEAYYSDLARFNTRAEAQQHGERSLGHDDFILAELNGDQCVQTYFGSDPEPRWQREEVIGINKEFGWPIPRIKKDEETVWEY